MILLIEEILHLCSLSHYLQGFTHPRWCRISSINSINVGMGSINSMPSLLSRAGLERAATARKKSQKFSSIPSEFWCVFSGRKSRTKEPNSWSSIEHFSVFVAISVWDLCLKGQTPCGELQRFSNGWDRGTSRCSTLLMPHVPQQLQRRCLGVDSSHAGYGNALPRNFGVTGKTSPFLWA